MKIAIIGTGAVGGYYGALLAKAGNDVHFLLHSDYEHVRQHGLKIESPIGNFDLPQVNAYKSVHDMPQCELVIVATKSTTNHLKAELLPPLCQEANKVLVLQNGIGLEKTFQELVPNSQIFGGLCFLCSNKIGPGHIRHLDYGTIKLGHYIGEKAAGLSKELQEINTVLSKAKISTELSEDINKARWEKLVWNAAFNGTCTVLNQTTDKLAQFAKTRSLLFNIMSEVIEAAQACGHNIDKLFADHMMALTDNMAAYNPSMKLDREASRPLEVKAIYWNAINEAAENHFDMKLCRALAQQLDFIDQTNKSI